MNSTNLTSLQRMSEEEVIVKAQEGDKECYAILYRKYFPVIYKHILTNCMRPPFDNPQIAEELTQETFIKAFKKLFQFRVEEGRFENWLKRIAVNLEIDHFRNSRKEETYQKQTGLVSNYKSAKSFQEVDRAIDSKKVVESILAELSPTYRTIIEMRFIEELSTNEVAIKLYGSDSEENRQTVARTLYKAIQAAMKVAEKLKD